MLRAVGAYLDLSTGTDRVKLMIKVKLVRSKIGCNPKQRQVLEALGLRRMHMVKEFKDTAAIRGMVTKVQHMVEVVE